MRRRLLARSPARRPRRRRVVCSRRRLLSERSKPLREGANAASPTRNPRKPSKHRTSSHLGRSMPAPALAATATIASERLFLTLAQSSPARAAIPGSARDAAARTTTRAADRGPRAGADGRHLRRHDGRPDLPRDDAAARGQAGPSLDLPTRLTPQVFGYPGGAILPVFDAICALTCAWLD